jgi:putative ABC transport system permease protein
MLLARNRDMQDFLMDLRYGLRTLVRNPAPTAIALIALALGIGANAAIFTVVNALMLRDLPFRDPDRLVAVYERRPKQGRERNVVSIPDFVDWRRRARSFEGLAAYMGGGFSLTGAGEPEALSGCAVSANLFDVLGAKAALGRTFRADEDRPEAPPVVVLSHGLWQRRFGADPSLVGKSLTLDGKSHTVTGILPREFRLFTTAFDVWVPATLRLDANRGLHNLNVIGRLRAGVSLEQARAEMTALGAELERQYPQTNTGHTVNVFPLHDEIVREARPALLLLLAAVGLVLLIACANVANLLMARATARQEEVALRAVLGAGRGRLVRQFLTESLLLGLIGGAAGLLLALWGTDFLERSLASSLPQVRDFELDVRVLGFTLLLSLLTGIVFGLAPAFGAAGATPGGALRAGGRTSSDGAGRVRSTLVVAETALALMLLVGAGLLMRSFVRLLDEDPGFAREGVLTLRVNPPRSRYAAGAQTAAFFEQAVERLEALPGVVAAGAVSHLPLSGQDSSRNFRIEGRDAATFIEQYNAAMRMASPGYFRAMGIPLRRGRLLGAADREGAPRVLVINEAMARRYWPGADPIGGRVFSGFGDQPFEVIGVVGDVRHQALSQEPMPEMYFSSLQVPWGGMNLVVRTRTRAEDHFAAVRGVIRSLERDAPIAAMRTLETVVAESLAQPRLNMLLLSVFAGVALALAAVGIYGVVSWSVGRRTREMGIRMALGADRVSVIAEVLRESLQPVVLGVAIGLSGALALGGLLERLLYGVEPSDPATLLMVPLILLAVALLAAYLPARRATRVDPMVALRYE